jgi:hypothetical protein
MTRYVPLQLGEARQLLGQTRKAAQRETSHSDEQQHQGWLRRVMKRADAKRAALGLVVVDGIWCRTEVCDG